MSQPKALITRVALRTIYHSRTYQQKATLSTATAAMENKQASTTVTDAQADTRRSPPLPKIRPDGARLLSCDGGGVKGVSSVTMLKAIMDRVREIERERGSKNTQTRRPVDYFDLAAGTSTGEHSTSNGFHH